MKSLCMVLLAVAFVESFIPVSKPWRRPSQKIVPQYITIHSTGNVSTGADAWRHAIALRRGIKTKGTYVSWHFSVDDKRVVQNLPVTERGVHCGRGNAVSIGIEICVNRDGNLRKAVENAIILTRILMKKYRIPASRVVTHNFWTGKACPAIFYSNGRIDRRWLAFKQGLR